MKHLVATIGSKCHPLGSLGPCNLYFNGMVKKKVCSLEGSRAPFFTFSFPGGGHGTEKRKLYLSHGHGLCSSRKTLGVSVNAQTPGKLEGTLLFSTVTTKLETLICPEGTGKMKNLQSRNNERSSPMPDWKINKCACRVYF